MFVGINAMRQQFITHGQEDSFRRFQPAVYLQLPCRQSLAKHHQAQLGLAVCLLWAVVGARIDVMQTELRLPVVIACDKYYSALGLQKRVN